MKVQFLQKLLDRPIADSDERIFEVLTRYAFPSAPEKKLSSLILDQISTRSLEREDVDVASHFCDILLSLWNQCLQESYVGESILEYQLL
jgi:hypothetical protein